MVRDPGKQERRRGSQTLDGPGTPYQLVVASDATGRDHHRPRPQRELPRHGARAARASRHGARREDFAVHPGHRAPVAHQPTDAMTERESNAAPRRELADAPLERLDDRGAGPPGDVKTRHAVARPTRAGRAPLRPAHGGEPSQAEPVQPRALLAAREIEVGLRPASWPGILRAIEPRRREPVAGGQLARVPDAESALFGRIHEEQSTERPEGLAAEALLALLVEQEDRAARASRLTGGDETGEPRAHDDDVRVHRAHASAIYRRG